MKRPEAAVQAERVRVAFQQTPVAAVVSVVNATLIAVVMALAERDRRAYAWLAVAVLVAAARLGLWWAFGRAAPAVARYRPWALASVSGALSAGLLWGGGSFWLFSESETYQLLWAFLIGGMCAGAAALHYAHLPTALAFMLPAGALLAARFALEGSGRSAAAAAMIAVFLAALVVTSRRSSRYFGEVLQLRFDLTQRMSELDTAKTKLREEVAERRATEASLRQAQKMEAVGQLTGGVAHDFNNLLMVVMSGFDMIRRRPDDRARVTKLAEAGLEAAERGARLTRQLLSFARRKDLRPETMNPNALLLGTEPLLRRALGEAVHLDFVLDPGLQPVRVDAAEFEAAVLNLVVNARDALPPERGGRIAVASRNAELDIAAAAALNNADATPGAYAVVSVADDGCGMDAATLARAFEPFFTTKGVGKGSGLGLSQAYGFARAAGGFVELRSTPGAGTTVELWLPCGGVDNVAEHSARHAETGATSAASMRRPEVGQAVLAVEDDPAVLASVVENLADIGYRVLTARDASEALEQLHGPEPIDVLFSDVVMPGGMDGVRLAAEATRVRPGLRVLLTSGYTGQALSGHQLPADIPILPKPYRQEQLAKQLRLVLHKVSRP